MSSRISVVSTESHLEALSAQFANIKRAALTTEAGLRVILQKMGDVIADIYDFGYELRKDRATYESFVRANSNRSNPLGKKSAENNWHPLMHIAFDSSDADAGDISRWTRSMMYIFQAKPPQVPTREFIAQHGALYKFLDAAQNYLNPDRSPVSRSEPEDVPEPVGGGSTPIAPHNPHPTSGLHQDRILRHLAVALRGLRGFTHEEFIRPRNKSVPTATRAFVLFNTAQGSTVLMVARTRTFACGEARLPQALSALGTQTYYLDDTAAGWLVDQFAASANGWRLHIDGTVAVFESSHNVRIEAKPLQDVPHASDLRCEGFFSGMSPPLSIAHAQVRTVDKWRTKRAQWIHRHRSNAEQVWNVAEQRHNFLDGGRVGSAWGPHRASSLPPMPTMFDLRYQQGEIHVGYFEQLRIAGSFLRNEYMVLAQASAPVAIAPERWLKQEDVRSLRKTLMACSQPARAWLADGDIAQCALIVEAVSEDVGFKAVLPLAHTLTGIRAPACAPLADKAIVPINGASEATEAASETTLSLPSPRLALSDPSIQPHCSLSVDDIQTLVRAQFAAYIISYRSPNEDMWHARRLNFRRQLSWWLVHTDVPLHLWLSGWSQDELDRFDQESEGLIANIGERYGPSSIVLAPPARLIVNRAACLQAFYGSDALWGVMLDDDAVLYTGKPHHNSANNFFAEMAANGTDQYNQIDVFYPLNPQKSPYTERHSKDPDKYQGHHVFTPATDLKGSMFVVRNFRKSDRPLVLPPADYGQELHGEDTAFAIEALARKCKIMRCENIILNEYSAPSYFAGVPNHDRTRAMQQGNERLAQLYGDRGLRMMREGDPRFHRANSRSDAPADRSHLLFKDDFILRCFGELPRPVHVRKPVHIPGS